MIIKTGKNYILELEVKPYRHLHNVELYQTFPEAQRPRRQRILQLTLNDLELRTFRKGLAS